MKPYYEHAGITIYYGDCREVLPEFGPYSKFDRILTDPPYGVGASSGTGKYGRLRAAANVHPEWDKSAVDLSHLPEIPTIIWGGNYFKLKPSRMFLLWDKGAGFAGRDFAECEQAWCSWDGNARIFRRDPLAARDYIGKEHPTEKPVSLMAWCLKQFPTSPEFDIFGPGIVCDPYCGGGSTLVAAKSLGLSAIGIEVEERYCEIAARRMSQEFFEFA